MLSFRRRNRLGPFIYFLVTKEEREVGAHVKHPGLRGLHRPSNHFVYVSSTCLAILLCQFDRKRERDKITIDWPINRRPLSDNRASTAFETNRYLCVISWYYRTPVKAIVHTCHATWSRSPSFLVRRVRSFRRSERFYFISFRLLSLLLRYQHVDCRANFIYSVLAAATDWNVDGLLYK